jgi:hypothetical protein
LTKTLPRTFKHFVVKTSDHLQVISRTQGAFGEKQPFADLSAAQQWTELMASVLTSDQLRKVISEVDEGLKVVSEGFLHSAENYVSSVSPSVAQALRSLPNRQTNAQQSAQN